MVITVVTSNFFPEDAGIPNVKKLNLCMKSQLVVSLDSAEVHKNCHVCLSYWYFH